MRCRKCRHERVRHGLGGCNDCECHGEFQTPASRPLLKETRSGGNLLKQHGAKGSRTKDSPSRVSKGGSFRGGKVQPPR